MSRRRYYYPSAWEYLLLLVAIGAGGPALIFLIIALVTGVHP